jgi:membrane protease subunit (stomatin/prohibitin family)
MTMWDSIKKQFIDVIEWTEEGESTLAFRYPMRDREIQYGAQLTVRESQRAVFVNEGAVADVFGPGRYKLVTKTIPVLTALRNWDKLFESPFKSDVYFFSTRLKVDQKWGTANPITIRDQDFGAVRMRAYGNYSYRIADPRLFHSKVSGTVETYSVDDLAGQLRTMVVATITDLFGESRVPFLDLAARQDELAQQLREKLGAGFAALGLELAGFVIENLSLPDELQKMLDQRISMNMVGDMKRYAQYNVGANIGTAIGAAAANPGGLAGIGGGIASGFAMGKALSQALSQAVAPDATPDAREGAAQAGADVTALIGKLHDLKNKGAITEDEFNAKKADLLGKLG